MRGEEIIEKTSDMGFQISDLQTQNEDTQERTKTSYPKSKIRNPERSLPVGKSEIVLLVEDNADVRAFIQHHLESEYIIKEAIDGADGLEKAIEIGPDLIISDVMMPKLDGYRFCKKLKTDEKPAIFPLFC